MARYENIWTIFVVTIASIASISIEGAPYDDHKPSTSLQHITSSQDVLLSSLNANIPVHDKIDAVLSYLKEKNNKDRLAMQLQTAELKGAGLKLVVSCPKGRYGYTALYFARISKLAYKSYSYVKSNMQDYINDNRLEVIFRIRGDVCQGFIAASGNTVIVAFAGTESFENKPLDLSVEPDAFYGIQCHEDFVSAFFAVYEDVAQEVGGLMNSKRKSLRITGHSRGGAVATLMTHYFKSVGYDPVMYVYGSPPVCTTDLTEKFGKRSKIFTLLQEPGSTGHSRANPFGYKKPAADHLLSESNEQNSYGSNSNTISMYIEYLENCQARVG